MNKIVELRNELTDIEKEVDNQSSDIFNETILTEEDSAKVEEMKTDKRVVVIEDNLNGAIEIPVDSYLDALDKDISYMKNNKIKLLSKKVEKTKEDLDDEAKNYLISVSNKEDASKEDIDKIIEDAISSVKEKLNLTEVDSSVINKLNKLSPDEVIKMFPKEYLETFTKYGDTFNKLKVKEDILTTFAYCVSIGPEMDKLNAEIERKNRMIDLLLKLNDVNIDFAELISSDESLKDMASRILHQSNELNNKYKKYVKTPDAINNVYTQKRYTLEKLNMEYIKFRDTLTDPDDIEQVTGEINNNIAMINVYDRILNLDNFTTVVNSIVANAKNGLNLRDLSSKAFVTFDGFKKLKEEIAIPGFTGKEKNSKEVYLNYLTYFKNLIPVYNSVLSFAKDHGDEDLSPITVDGDVFAKCIIVVLGKITKNLTKKYDINSSCEIVIMFDMICRLGTELFMLDKINRVLEPMYDIIK